MIGLSEEMSLTHDATGNLFRRFMPRRKEIANSGDVRTFDLKVYPTLYFTQFHPSNTFVKWVVVEVAAIGEIPAEMKVFHLKGGQYAVFHYKGLSSDPTIFRYIYNEWLPNSNYQLDDRPHFEILGPKTKLNDPTSEEDIWIPIRMRSEGLK